jgi:hypothetical protein
MVVVIDWHSIGRCGFDPQRCYFFIYSVGLPYNLHCMMLSHLIFYYLLFCVCVCVCVLLLFSVFFGSSLAYWPGMACTCQCLTSLHLTAFVTLCP